VRKPLITSGETAALSTVRVKLVVPVSWRFELSWTDTWGVKVPAACGSPLIVSVDPLPLAVSPAGSPATDQV
jgi:hypothetical protein